MKLLYHLNEDKITKLPVLLSSEVEDLIEDIDYSNRFNENELVQFYCDLEGVIMWISNTSIAWDNSNSFRHFNNGTTYLERFGFKITYIIKVNETSHQSFVYILTLNFNSDDYGLHIPSYITENNNTKRQNTMKQKIRLTEGDLHRIIRNCVNEALDELDARTYASYADKRQAQGQTDKARLGREAAVNAWNNEYGYSNTNYNDSRSNVSSTHNSVHMDDNYGVNQFRRKNYRDNDGCNMVSMNQYKYDPHNNKGYISGMDKSIYDDHTNMSEPEEYNHNVLYGKSARGARVARQMATGSGKYVKRQGWQ